jgi:hypothetical protein
VCLSGRVNFKWSCTRRVTLKTRGHRPKFTIAPANSLLRRSGCCQSCKLPSMVAPSGRSTVRHLLRTASCDGSVCQAAQAVIFETLLADYCRSQRLNGPSRQIFDATQLSFSYTLRSAPGLPRLVKKVTGLLVSQWLGIPVLLLLVGQC